MITVYALVILLVLLLTKLRSIHVTSVKSVYLTVMHTLIYQKVCRSLLLINYSKYLSVNAKFHLASYQQSKLKLLVKVIPVVVNLVVDVTIAVVAVVNSVVTVKTEAIVAIAKIEETVAVVMIEAVAADHSFNKLS